MRRSNNCVYPWQHLLAVFNRWEFPSALTWCDVLTIILCITGYGSLQCHWFIHVPPGHKILLYFDDFEVEGNPAGIVQKSCWWLFCSIAFYILHFCGACTFTSIQSIQDEFNILSKINQNNIFYKYFDNFPLFRAWLSRRRAEGVALENWPGENTDRALWRHPGHLQADPLRDKHPAAQLLPGRQGGRGQGLQGDMDWDKGNTESWPKRK